MSTPLVSVIVPVFNAALDVTDALASAQAQSVPDIEILVIDDASTDGTRAVVEALAETDPRIRLLALSRNAGPSAARNHGIDRARGIWVALLDADDAWHPNRLATLLRLAEAQDADMVSDNLLLCGTDKLAGTPMIPPDLLAEPRLLDAAEFVMRNVGTRQHPRVSFGFMKPVLRRAFLEQHGLRYDVRNRFGEDFLLYVECLMHGARWWVTPEPHYLYAVRAGSLTEVQSAADLGRIREMERRLLADPRTAADPALRQALRRHKRTIDRNFHYRGFTDALKGGTKLRAARLLLSSAESFLCVARESMVQLPVVAAKFWRGGYRL